MDLRAETERIDVTSSVPYADESWRFTDTAGHQHRYDHGYPTLAWVVDETWWCGDCGDEHEEGHYECPLCGEVITPGTAGPDLYRRYIPGRTTYYLDDEEISPERYRDLVAELRSRPAT